MGAKNRRDIEKYSGVILHCSHLEPLELKGVHIFFVKRDVKLEGMKKNYRSKIGSEEELNM